MKHKHTPKILDGFLILLVFLIFAFFYQKQFKQTEPLSATAFKLNTVVSIRIYDSTDESLIDEAMALCDRYEALFSRTKESSELYKLNHGTLPQENDGFLVSPETAELIVKGLEYCNLSNGGFDIAIEPVSSLWDFTSEEKVIPTEKQLAEALPLIDYNSVILTGNHVRFQKEGMGLDLGAIAKGYIADRMKDFLISKGIKSATISLGGNILCIGEKPDGTPFKVGIQKPFSDRGETVSVASVKDKSVVSSGVYERYFEKDGQFYHHILNPRTGYPYDNSLLAVTIISDESVDGDGLSTTCFALGLEEGMKLINSLPDVEAVFITEDNELHYSDNFPLAK